MNKTFHDRLVKITNFMATKTGMKESAIHDKRRVIVHHMIKLLIYPESQDRNHWTKEIITQVEFIDRKREISGPKKKLSAGRIRTQLESDNIVDVDELDDRLVETISDESKVPKSKVRYSIDLEELYVSVLSLFDQLEDYFNDKFDRNELYLRLLHSFLWNRNMSLSECDDLMNKWKMFK